MKYPVVIEAVYVPQRRHLKGDHFFNMTLDDPLLPKKTKVKNAPWDARLFSWMVSCPPSWVKTGYTGNFYKTGGEDKPFSPRIEILLGNFIHDHDITQKARGTQPFGSYLRGHVNTCRGLFPTDPVLPKRTYNFFEVQHYYTSDKVHGDFTEDQVYQTYFGLKVLLQEGFIREDFQVFCFDKGWGKYMSNPFITPSVGEIIRFWEKTPYAEALVRWKKFAKYGKTYSDADEALNQLAITPLTMKPILLNRKRIFEVALDIASKLGISKIVAVWVWKSRVAGTSKETSDVDLWVQIPEEYAEKAEEFDKEVAAFPYNIRTPHLDYTKWKYPVLIYHHKEEQLTLNFGDDCWGLPLDIHIGCALPPMKPYIKL